MNITGYDELNNTVALKINVEATTQNNNRSSKRLIDLVPSAMIFTSKSQVLSVVAYYNEEINISQQHEIQIHSIVNNIVESAKFNLQFKECPPGYTLNTLMEEKFYKSCECNHNDNNIVTCNGTSITFKKLLWAANDPKRYDRLFTYPCPHGYCACSEKQNEMCIHVFDSSDPDSQCVCERRGVLCGECINNTAFSILFNKCISCTDNLEWLIIILVVVDVVVIAAFVRLLIHIKYPAWVFPILFYIQFLPYGTEAITNGFDLFRPYLYYILSALSFYFPYDFCLSDEINPSFLYAIRFLPALIAVVVTPVTLLVSWRWLKKSNTPWYSIWMLLLLLYNHTVYSAISILNCPMVPLNGSYSRQWYYAGHIKCFTDGHIVASALAVIFLLLCVLLIFGTFVLSVKKIHHPTWIKRLQDSLQIIISSKYKWWYSLELSRRFILIPMIILFPGNKYPEFFLFCVLSIIVIYAKPYSTSSANNCEIFLSVGTILIFLISFQDAFRNSPSIAYSDNINQCAAQVELIPVSTILIAVLYYLPLFVGALYGIYYLCSKLYQILRPKAGLNTHQFEYIPMDFNLNRSATQSTIILRNNEIEHVWESLDDENKFMSIEFNQFLDTTK